MVADQFVYNMADQLRHEPSESKDNEVNLPTETFSSPEIHESKISQKNVEEENNELDSNYVNDNESEIDLPVSVADENEDPQLGGINDPGSGRESHREEGHRGEVKDSIEANRIATDNERDSQKKGHVQTENPPKRTTRHRAEYVHPIEDPLDKALKYLAKHDVLQLFQVLTAKMVYTLPEDPIDYMMTEVESIRDLDRLRKGVIKRSNIAKEENRK